MSSRSSAGASVITLQFDLSLNIDIAEQEVQAAINAAGNLLPQSLPAPPIYAKVNPADAPILTLAVTSTSMPITQVEDLADTRIAQKISQLVGRRPGQHQRRAAPGGAHPGQPAGAGRLRPEHRRSAHHDLATPTRMRPRAASTAPRAPIRSTPTIRSRAPTQYANIIVAYRNNDPVRLSDVATRDAERGEQQARQLDEHDAGHSAQCAAPAGRQRDRGGQPDPQGAAGHPQLAAGQRRRHGADRPHQHHPRLGQRRGVRAVAGGGAGGAGDLPVPAQRTGDDHSEPVGAAVADRHLRGDVSVRLQPQQPVADGADHRLRASWSTMPS